MGRAARRSTSTNRHAPNGPASPARNAAWWLCCWAALLCLACSAVRASGTDADAGDEWRKAEEAVERLNAANAEAKALGDKLHPYVGHYCAGLAP